MRDERSRSDGPPPRETFELLGDETRAEILRVLSEARGGDLPPALSFSELRDRLAVDTRSSQFNYHLDRLCGTFVEDRSDGSGQLVDAFVAEETGYALRPTGTFLTRLVTAASTPADTPAERDAFDTDTDCHYCGTRLRARYANLTFRVWCPGCDHQYVYTLTPPGLVAGDPDPAHLLDRADGYLRRKYTTFARGICPLCANAAPPEIIAPESINWPGAERLRATVRRRCDHCGNLNYALVGTELLTDPGLVSFCRETGLDVTETRLWTLPFALTDRHTTVDADPPWTATLSLRRGGETFELAVDERLTVVERRRS
jgi:DNA-binding transcriptional ArsR family regulator